MWKSVDGVAIVAPRSPTAPGSRASRCCPRSPPLDSCDWVNSKGDVVLAGLDAFRLWACATFAVVSRAIAPQGVENSRYFPGQRHYGNVPPAALGNLLGPLHHRVLRTSAPGRPGRLHQRPTQFASSGLGDGSLSLSLGAGVLPGS